jgi:quinol-cytochrome oxidoreductase complex cytochrome b subunit
LPGPFNGDKEEGSMTEISEEEKTIPFYPDHIKTEAIVTVVILLIAFGIGVIALFNPIGVDEPADPMTTPAHTKPEWYFLFLYEILKYVPKTLGSILPFVGLLILTVWPFLDSKEDNRTAKRKRIILVSLVMLAIILLTIIGGS